MRLTTAVRGGPHDTRVASRPRTRAQSGGRTAPGPSHLPHRHFRGSRAAFSIGLPGTAHAAEGDTRKITADPFTLGVASGDPEPSSVVLWTRLAASPYEPGSGLPQVRFPVLWELAHDARFTRIVKRGSATAHPEFHHSVHVEATGLDPDRVYHYRFRAGHWISPADAPAPRPPAAPGSVS